tara:strand:+ start:7530 stop:8468 length:939 start_codon:yes stop_codon:yes gene_type:complete
MAFLDNSGDIILDAVLTDTGRMRLAKADGTFKITKFALADDEINYKLYDKNNSSGSAYYDLQILQTPVLEAFTNNASSMKSKLLSIARNDLLYLPVLKLYDGAGYGMDAAAQAFVVLVDESTVTSAIGSAGTSFNAGILNGNEAGAGTNSIRADQGLDTTQISFSLPLDPDLRETQYLIEMDNRLGTLYSGGPASVAATLSFIDDDNIATYYLTENTDTAFVQSLSSVTNATTGGGTNIAGPRGSFLNIKIASTMSLKTNSFFMNVLGSSGTVTVQGGLTSGTYKFIDTILSVTGLTTGYRIDIPIRYVKKN